MAHTTAHTSDTPALHIDGLRFRYGSGEPWVTALDAFTVNPGEQVLLTGGSGSGKSTLLQLIAGIISPGEGLVCVSGTDVHSLHGASRDRFRGRTIGMLFQTFNLLPGFTASENVMLAMMFSDVPPAEHRDRAVRLLGELGIDRPDAPAERLSIGQQQRVATARALACKPVLVLADEPTASLDPETSVQAMDLVQAMCRHQDAALLCVSHDPMLVDRFDRRVALEEINRIGDQVSVGGA